MSYDNIYNILKRFNNLTETKPAPTSTSKMLSESKSAEKCNECGMLEAKCTCDHTEAKKADKEKKSAIGEAVAKVERMLAQKWINENEAKERPYVCVHAKKGKCEVKASSSYGAAQKAAEKWKLKSTAGIDAHLADVEHDASSLGEGYTNEGSEDHGDEDDIKAKRRKEREPDPDWDRIKKEDVLSPKQKKIAKVAPPTDKIDGKDFAALRKGKSTNEGEMTPKQQKFAKLAPPKDKITYADKIAGATKKTNEGFPTVADAKKRESEKSGKTAYGTKTKTATGTKHERDYDKEDETSGSVGRPTNKSKDKFAK